MKSIENEGCRTLLTTPTPVPATHGERSTTVESNAMAQTPAAHHRRRQLSAARLAGEPRDAVEDGAARAHGHLARAGAVAGAGAGRRHPPRHPRHGAGRHRHHHRRRDAARELLQPLRHRARRHRHGQAGPRQGALGPRDAGAARGRQDQAHARGGGARHAVPARATPTAPPRSRCPAPSP